ncbi:MAG: glycosyltransferase family 2 protein, partial [Thermoleophilaceae bacterium]
MKLGIVIPTLRRYELLARVLDRLERQTADPTSFEVMLAPDAAEERCDRIRELAEGRPYRTCLAKAPRRGASAARNAGWREIGTPLVLFLDDDVLPEPRLVEEHLDWHAHHPGMDVGVLGHVRWARELRVTPFMRWLDRGIQFDYGRIRGDEAGWGRFCTANVSVKRALLEAVDGFDEALPYGYEDLDIAKRAHDQQGFRLLYARNAVGEHLQRTSLELFKGRIERNALAERSFVRLHPEIRPYFRDLF